MVRADKVAEVEEITRHLSESSATLLTDYRGLTVAELAELRARLRDAGATYRVVKNTLTRRAAADAGMEGLDEFLVGPTALVFCDDDPVAPARALTSFADGHDDLVVKAGFLEGRVLDREATEHLATLRSRDELLTALVGMLHGALAGFARLLQAKMVDAARLLRALEDEGGPAAKGFAVPGAGEAEPAEQTGTDTDEAPAGEAPEPADAADSDTGEAPEPADAADSDTGEAPEPGDDEASEDDEASG